MSSELEDLEGLSGESRLDGEDVRSQTELPIVEIRRAFRELREPPRTREVSSLKESFGL